MSLIMRLGDRVKMSYDALENYGQEYKNVVFEIVHKATKYMPAKQFYAEGRPDGYHPGYDEGIGGNVPLFDLQNIITGEYLPFSLYQWELRTA